MDIRVIRDAILIGNWFMSQHARVRAGKRMISDIDVIIALMSGEIIEDYPDDPRGASCLVLGHTPENRPIHIVCSQDSSGSIVIVTVYEPEPPKWVDKRTRGEKNATE